jgi:hypothetical protein
MRASLFFLSSRVKPFKGLTAMTLLWAFLVVLEMGSVSFAQPRGPYVPPKPAPTPAQPGAYSDSNTTYIFAAIGAFIPSEKSNSENFSNNFIGLPIELSGGLLFPVGRDIFVPFTVRYERRVANFVTGMSMEVTSIEPGVRYFFQHESSSPAMQHEFRIFGGVEGLLADASVTGSYVVSTNGMSTGTAIAERDYFNIGLGLDLGLMYPLTRTTSIEAIVHYAMYLASPIDDGGLGNIGGISLSLAYRFGF